MKKRILTSLFLVAAAVFSLLNFSYSWQSLNTDASEDSGEMGMTFDDTKVTYLVYKYDVTDSKGKEYAEGIGDINFNNYDLIFLQRNRYTPIVVRMAITRKTTMPMNGTLYLNIDRIVNDDASGTKMSEYSSSIMRFTAFIDNYGLASLNPDQIYMHVDETLYASTKQYMAYGSAVTIPDSSQVFTSVTKSGDDFVYTKTATIPVTLPYTESDWVTSGGDERDTLNVILYITYDEGLINCFKEDGLGSAIGTFSAGSDTIAFVNDLAMIQLTYEAAEGGDDSGE